MTKQYEIDAAYYQGLREGFDPEVAEDLGIPTSPESAERHIASAQEMTAASLRAVSLSEDPVEYIKCGDCLRFDCPGCSH